MEYKNIIDNPGQSVLAGTKMKSYIDPFIASTEITNPFTPHQGAARGGSVCRPDAADPAMNRWAELGHTGIDDVVQNMVDAETHPLVLPAGEEVK